MLYSVADLLPEGPSWVLIDGSHPHAATVAGRLAAVLNAWGRRCLALPVAPDSTPAAPPGPCVPAATIRLANGPGWRQVRDWDVVIRLRTPPDGHPHGADEEDSADIVIDLRDPDWPLIRCVAASLAGRWRWLVTESPAFFGPRAVTELGDDQPALAANTCAPRHGASGGMPVISG